MKKVILIAMVLLWCGALKAQPENLLQKFDRIYKTVYETTGDFNIFTVPVKFESTITITTIQTEPSKSFKLQLQIPIDQIKKKASPQRNLKAQIGELIAIGTAMYIWRDELTEFSNKHDKWAHGMLAFGLTKYFGWKFSLGFMLSIEATQGDVFGLKGRYKDTAGDLLANGAGILLAWKFKF